jgi:hypothetical protein
MGGESPPGLPTSRASDSVLVKLKGWWFRLLRSDVRREAFIAFIGFIGIGSAQAKW